jgi:tRNA pseudouridine38-40 synthase
MRIKLTVEYEGTNYCGWQRQENAVSVQQVLEDALYKLIGEKTPITGAGRTDAGVHAVAQICHFDTESEIPPFKFAHALNFALPKDIRIKKSEQVADEFHSRFDAKAKWYRYSIYNHTHASALNRYTNSHVSYPLDDKLMSDVLSSILGKHDFKAFLAAGSAVKDTEREIYVAECRRFGDYIIIDIIGNGFLYNMVRIIAGTLIDIGRGKLSPAAIKYMLQTGDREQGGITAPPEGLRLMAIFYDNIPTYEGYIALRSQFDGYTTA